ncbi:MAG: glycosyltransferase, partial [Gammaproteobacteria bacterium]
RVLFRSAFTTAYRERGHRVLVAAPEFEGRDPAEQDVVRVAAMQNFNGSDFSVMLPDNGVLDTAVERFRPAIIHAHHPFLVGASAQRLALLHDLPLVFTHHTMYERYTHYAPGDSPLLKRFVANLSTDFANLAREVFAPSESIARVLARRGVTSPITVIPTGLPRTAYDGGSRVGMRAALGLPRSAVVVGHVGRLAPEKNLDFLARAVCTYLGSNPAAYFLVVGAGPMRGEIGAIAERAGVAGRVLLTGALEPPLLESAYRAMDVFAFASHSETQGMVLTEAMAARTPVVALDAPGARDVVRDGYNGRLLGEADERTFADALAWVATRPANARRALGRHALASAREYALDTCADRALMRYRALLEEPATPRAAYQDQWQQTMQRIGAEWSVIKGLADAAGRALTRPRADRDDAPSEAPSQR